MTKNGLAHEIPDSPGRRKLAILATLVETAKLNSIEPQAWLADG